MKTILGVDIGSVAIKTVLMRDNKVLHAASRRLNASIPQSLLLSLGELDELPVRPEGWVLTGRGAAGIAVQLGTVPVNEILAQASGARQLVPECGSLIDIGGHDAAYILLEAAAPGRGAAIKDFSLNSKCAAGTGSFLDQQAARLGIAIEEEFAALALRGASIPRIAGRCSVFAKSDMIHLQQAATPEADILAGLCRAMAESIRSDIIRDLKLALPVVFAGGVSRNRAMVRHLREVLRLQETELLVPEMAPWCGAIGAVSRRAAESRVDPWPGIDAIRKNLASASARTVRQAAYPPLTSAPVPPVVAAPEGRSGATTEAFLGIDIGSISTNLVLLSPDGTLLAKQYLMTAGRPIEAVNQGLAVFREQFGSSLAVLGCGTTGSGRYLIGDMFGADLVKNEITAQARGAVFLVPDADTIFEIGGQDSKYISIREGQVSDFTMNKACAAGTGSFLEEQAGLMGISVKDEFSDLALRSVKPTPLGQRCTVFIESDLVRRLGEGETREDLCAGLAYSIVHNYINRVVENRPLGEKILFQGGTAFNKAVGAAFRLVTGREVIVPPHNEVTGALGMAVIVRDAWQQQTFATAFRGLDAPEIRYTVKSFTCRECANACEVRCVEREGAGAPLFYGHRCEKYDTVAAGDNERLDFSLIRNRLFNKALAAGPEEGARGRVGLPRGLSFHETLPFWTAFWADLGYRPVVSPETNRKLIKAGTSRTHADICFPLKVFHGHIGQLLESGVDFCFVPALVNMELPGSRSEHNFSCPLSQSAPFLVRAAFRDRAPRIHSPSLHMQYGPGPVLKELAPMARELGIPRKALRRALARAREAQQVYERAVKDAARAFLVRTRGMKKILLIGRPYNLSDSGLNLDIPRKLSELGVPSLPLDVLALLRPDDSHGNWRDLYWRYGQQILRLLEETSLDPEMLPVYLTNFNCGPDSFLLHYAARIRKNLPLLVLELDEHSADAGIITRLEAFLDSAGQRGREIPPVHRARPAGARWSFHGKKVFIPNMCDDALAIAAGFRSEGIDSVVLDEPDAENVRLGRRYTSGKECYPMILTTGDLFKLQARSDHVPGRSVFFMPTTNGPCRFGEYARLQEMILEENGVSGISIFSPSSGDGYDALRELSSRFYYTIWKGMACIDILFKTRLLLRPLEANPGDTDRVYRECLKMIETNLERGGRRLLGTMQVCADRFAAIPVVARDLVRIGLVGEIYVRSNRFANSDIIRAAESLGVAVMPAPFGEWSFYANYLSRKNNLDQGRFLAALTDTFKNRLQRSLEHRYQAPFRKVAIFREPAIADVVRNAASWLDQAVRGEAILSLGKAIDFIRRGFSGVINVMPFSCMPGLIVSSLSPAVREAHGGIPWLDISFEDSERKIDLTHLEAFVEQVKQYAGRGN